MSVVGALATIIYAITILTVTSGVAAYALYKWRERQRNKAPKKARARLNYFVEYRLAEPDPDASISVVAVLKQRPSVRVWASLAVAVSITVGLLVFVYRRVQEGSVSPSLATGSESRGAMPDLAVAPRVAASLFPSPSFDTNGDGLVEDDERLRLHAEVPQFVLLSSDDNGSVSGLEWLRATLGARGLLGKTTYFMTGNYMEGRPNYMGGPVDDWWQIEANEGYVGLHGMSHAEGAQTWSLLKWHDELDGVLQEMVRKLATPPSWKWDSYPWGSRAPFLVVDDAYFGALESLRPRILYDSSLLVHPVGVAPKDADSPRDTPWPFGLDTPLPAEVDGPYAGTSTSKIPIARHPIWEIPVYAWVMQNRDGISSWQPSLDYNLFKTYPCEAPEGNQRAVDAVIENLRAHRDGNRAPFHIGLHAQNYSVGRACERATIVGVLREIDQLVKEGDNLRFIAMPELLEWMGKHRRVVPTP